jgi:hypothetical protein
MKNILIIALILTSFVGVKSQTQFNAKFGKSIGHNFNQFQTQPLEMTDIMYDFEAGHKFGQVEIFGNYSQDYSYEGALGKRALPDLYGKPGEITTVDLKQNLSSWTVGVKYFVNTNSNVKPFISMGIGEATLQDMQSHVVPNDQYNVWQICIPYSTMKSRTIKYSIGFRYNSTETFFFQGQVDYQTFTGRSHEIIDFQNREMVSAKIGIGTYL